MKVEKLLEMNGRASVEELTDTIYGMAEEAAYNESAEGGQSVGGDQIFAAFKNIMQGIKAGVVARIEQG